MTYQITITKHETKPVRKRGEHTVIDERPWTQAESMIFQQPTQRQFLRIAFAV